MRKRRILFVEFVASIKGKSLPQRVVFDGLAWGNGYYGGQEKDWMVHLEQDMSSFGTKFEGQR